MLTINYPDTCQPESQYALEVILTDFLGVPYHATTYSGDVFQLEHDNRTLSIASSFLPALAEGTAKEAMETKPGDWNSRTTGWDIELTDPLIPVLFGAPEHHEDQSHIHIGIDIFGSAFFMLSRYEETISEQRDKHDRFPVTSAVAYQRGFLMRPIVDEYVEILWAAMKRLWPNLKRKERSFQVIPTHDVDEPCLAMSIDSIKQLARRCGGDVLKRRDVAMATRTLKAYLQTRSHGAGIPDDDPYNSFGWLMEQSERAGVKSRFYFMTEDEPDHLLGGRYTLDLPHMQSLLTGISDRGHEIGIHPTSDSYRSSNELSRQAEKIRNALENCRIDQEVNGGRHHFLRWRADETPRLWNDAGFKYDSTLSHAEHVGFRCGTCHPFPLWDFGERQMLNVKELPLILMEGSLLADYYMGCSVDEARLKIEQLRRAVKTVRGNFVFLWHNSMLQTKADRMLYRACLVG